MATNLSFQIQHYTWAPLLENPLKRVPTLTKSTSRTMKSVINERKGKVNKMILSEDVLECWRLWEKMFLKWEVISYYYSSEKSSRLRLSDSLWNVKWGVVMCCSQSPDDQGLQSEYCTEEKWQTEHIFSFFPFQKAKIYRRHWL